MIPSDNKTKSPIIVSTLHKESKTPKDIRQERLDQLMESIENGFPGFYQALATLAEEHKSHPSD